MLPASSRPQLTPVALDAIVAMRSVDRRGAALAQIGEQLDDCQARMALGVVPLSASPAAHVTLLAVTSGALQEHDTRVFLEAAYQTLLAQPLRVAASAAAALRALEPLLDAPRAEGLRLRMGYLGRAAHAQVPDPQALLTLAVLLPRLTAQARAAAANILTAILSVDMQAGTADVRLLTRAAPALTAIGDTRLLAAYRALPRPPLWLGVVFAPYMADPAAAASLVGQLVRASANTSAAAWVGDALASLAPLLPAASVPEALHLARAVRALGARTRALVALAARLSDESRTEVLHLARSAALRSNGESRGEALAALIAAGVQ